MEEQQEAMLLEKQYKIPFALFREAFIAFQKKFVFPRNYAIMAVFLIVAGIYSYFVVNGSDQQRPIYCMIVVFCIVMCAMQWYNPRKIRRNLLEGVREIEEDRYRLRIYPGYLEIGTMLEPEDSTAQETDALFDDEPEEDFSGTRIYYNKGLHVHEYDSFLMIYQNKTMFYVIPKSVFTQEELGLLRQHFSNALGKTCHMQEQ
ncbi:MAG: YcxB family protein [Oscillospiraceae bacterium]|nr:YcxB family protein [Oscillospiraceae bacterium]MBQ8927856.1 YcxB family protein [Oscillospiraceae bacterium]